MPNTFLTTQQIARQTLPLLRNNLIFPALSYTDYCESYGKQGDTIQIKKPPIYTANEFDQNISIQDIKEDNVLVTLNKIADVSVEVTAKQMALNMSDFSAQVLKPAAVALAEKINADGLKLYKDIPFSTGTAGETPSDITAFTAAAKILNDNKAPLSERYAVWNSAALAAFQSIPGIVNAEKSGSTAALREGSIGRIIGLDNYMSQQVVNHIYGGLDVTGGTNPIIAPNTAVAAGATSMSVSASGGTNPILSGKLVRGDIFKVKGKQFVVTEDTEPINLGICTIKFYPAAPSGGFATTDAISLVKNHAANLVFHRNAFAFVTRPLETARGADSYVTSFEGLTLRVTVDYNIETKKQTMSIDTLYGYKTLYPQLAARVLG